LAGVAFEDPIPAEWSGRAKSWSLPSLRPYQRDAISSWVTQGKRGTIVLPTGAGKTRVGLAAAAIVRGPTVILCPTRVLLGQWMDAIRTSYAGPIGVIGDGEHSLQDVTVMTFESAFRKMDTIGQRFALLIVDEVHHFGSGRAEALEACVAPYRLGLTATAPEAGTKGAATVADLVGRVTFAMSIADLSGSHLAAFEVVRLRVALTREERKRYVDLARPFEELRDQLMRIHPGLDYDATLRAIGTTPPGRRAIGDWLRAVALAGFPSEKRKLAASLLERHRQDKVLVFAARATDAHEISMENFVPAITADIARSEREQILVRFRDGTYRCIVSAQVLNEGVDVPDANVAILLGGSLGVREQIQRVGRVLRPSPGKQALVYDVATTDTIDARRSDRKWRKLAAASTAAIPT
jgi:superfamily II DNA or RNA helicase